MNRPIKEIEFQVAGDEAASKLREVLAAVMDEPALEIEVWEHEDDRGLLRVVSAALGIRLPDQRAGELLRDTVNTLIETFRGTQEAVRIVIRVDGTSIPLSEVTDDMLDSWLPPEP